MIWYTTTAATLLPLPSRVCCVLQFNYMICSIIACAKSCKTFKWLSLYYSCVNLYYTAVANFSLSLESRYCLTTIHFFFLFSRSPVLSLLLLEEEEEEEKQLSAHYHFIFTIDFRMQFVVVVNYLIRFLQFCYLFMFIFLVSFNFSAICDAIYTYLFIVLSETFNSNNKK